IGVAFQSSSLMPSGGEMFAMLGSLPITNPQPPQPLAPPLCGYSLSLLYRHMCEKYVRKV
ncbi:MAG: hypothetical protein AB7G75_31465, partial [Candidatus Binatia bacterium]